MVCVNLFRGDERDIPLWFPVDAHVGDGNHWFQSEFLLRPVEEIFYVIQMFLGIVAQISIKFPVVVENIGRGFQDGVELFRHTEGLLLVTVFTELLIASGEVALDVLQQDVSSEFGRLLARRPQRTRCDAGEESMAIRTFIENLPSVGLWSDPFL